MRKTIWTWTARVIAVAAIPALLSCSEPEDDDPPRLDDLAGTGADVGAPPTDHRDRIGIYNWNVDDTSFAPSPGCGDRLNWGACKVQELGGRTIRVFLGPTPDIYQLWGGAPPATLVGVATSAPYVELFSRPFSTYLLTIYTAADTGNPWQAGYSDPAVRQAELDEVAALAEHLALTYPGKRFIFLNWEGDNAVRTYNTQEAWDGYVAWIQTRADGVDAARARVLQSHGFTPPLYSGLEFNAARSLDAGARPCTNDPATTLDRCVVSYVGPRVAVDYHSYSSWQSNASPDGRLLQNWEIGAQLTADLDAIQAALGGIGRNRILVGEFGHARQYFPDEGPLGCGAAKRSVASVVALTSWGAAYGINWQIIDNAPSSGGAGDFGILDGLGQPTASRELFSNLYTFQSGALPAYCPP